MRQLELKIPPLALCVFVALLATGAARYMPALHVALPGNRALALAALILGVLVLAAGALQFRLRRVTLDPRDPAKTKQIVSTGIYRFTRNPMYLGMALVLFGNAAWLSNWAGYALVVAFCVYITELQIKPEERMLLALFGAEYSAYLAKVRRWL